MRGINKVILVGAVGNEPELKKFDNGGSICSISLATSEVWNDKTSGERKEATEWHRIVFHQPLADIVMQYVKKGSKLYVEGGLKTRQWTDQNGSVRYITEIKAAHMQMLDSFNKNEVVAKNTSSPVVIAQSNHARHQQAEVSTYLTKEETFHADIPF